MSGNAATSERWAVRRGGCTCSDAYDTKEAAERNLVHYPAGSEVVFQVLADDGRRWYPHLIGGSR